MNNNKRTVTFSPVLRERLGHHIHGEFWADDIKAELHKRGLIKRPIHIISANMHSVMNSLFAEVSLKSSKGKKDIYEVYEDLSQSENKAMRSKVEAYAFKNGMSFIKDTSGTNINVQIFDAAAIDFSKINFDYTKKSLKTML